MAATPIGRKGAKTQSGLGWGTMLPCGEPPLRLRAFAANGHRRGSVTDEWINQE
jgi:hypothetical protein